MFHRRPRHPGHKGLEATMRIHRPAAETVREEPSVGERDLVIGAISGYGFEDIQYWVNSLDRSGFSGDRVVIAYDATFALVDELLRRGFHVATFGERSGSRRFYYPEKGFTHEDTSIDRFYKVWTYLNEIGRAYRFVVAIDVRDVIFQRDPAAWLEANLGNMRLNVGSEGMAVAEEPWNSEVMSASFGSRIHNHLASRDVYNAGTMAGRADTMRDFALNVFLCSRHNVIPYTDQPAANVLLSLEPYRKITRFNGPDDDWACQAATFAAESEYLASHRGSGHLPRPMFVDGVVKTPEGQPYCLVHQYDRVPAWSEAIASIYGE